MTRATGHGNFRDRQSVTVYLDERPFDIDGDEMHVWLEKPMCRWNLNDTTHNSFQETTYEILKAWIAFEMRCLAVRSLGMTFGVLWETNCVPKPTNVYQIMTDMSKPQAVLREFQPFMDLLLAFGTISTQDTSNGLLFGLLLIADFMRQHDFDPDPSGVIPAIIKFRQSQRINPQRIDFETQKNIENS